MANKIYNTMVLPMGFKESETETGYYELSMKEYALPDGMPINEEGKNQFIEDIASACKWLLHRYVIASCTGKDGKLDHTKMANYEDIENVPSEMPHRFFIACAVAMGCKLAKGYYIGKVNPSDIISALESGDMKACKKVAKEIADNNLNVADIEYMKTRKFSNLTDSEIENCYRNTISKKARWTRKGITTNAFVDRGRDIPYCNAFANEVLLAYLVKVFKFTPQIVSKAETYTAI